MEAKKTNPARLKAGEFYKLCRELEAIREPLPTTYAELARQMSEKLGRPVASSSVNEALQAIGKTLTAVPHINGGSTKERKQIAILARAVVGLYNRLGEPPPIDVRDMLG